MGCRETQNNAVHWVSPGVSYSSHRHTLLHGLPGDLEQRRALGQSGGVILFTLSYPSTWVPGDPEQRRALGQSGGVILFTPSYPSTWAARRPRTTPCTGSVRGCHTLHTVIPFYMGCRENQNNAVHWVSPGVSYSSHRHTLLHGLPRDPVQRRALGQSGGVILFTPSYPSTWAAGRPRTTPCTGSVRGCHTLHTVIPFYMGCRETQNNAVHWVSPGMFLCVCQCLCNYPCSALYPHSTAAGLLCSDSGAVLPV